MRRAATGDATLKDKTSQSYITINIEDAALSLLSPMDFPQNASERQAPTITRSERPGGFAAFAMFRRAGPRSKYH
jgi:hypothetical protein